MDSNSHSNSEIAALSMTRGVSQLLFNYLPGRTVDWEDGVAVVKLGNVRLSSVWEPSRAEVLLAEVNEQLKRWESRGGRIDRNFPDPLREAQRFTIGLPESVEARVLETAFLCSSCGTLFFPRGLPAASLFCPACHSRTVRQFGQVFVHGCGEIVAVSEYLPTTRKAKDGSLVPSKRRLRCPNCKEGGHLELSAMSERVKDMKVICKKCGHTVVDRFTATCPRCAKDIVKERAIGSVDRGDTDSTFVTRTAMRMTRYSANATYYPQSLTILRLDRPSVTGTPDDEQRNLWSLLPVGERPLRPVNPIDVIQELTKAAQAARQAGDSQRAAELMSRIAIAATSVVSPSVEDEKNDETEGIHLEIDVQSSIRESLAFRSTVTTIDAMTVIDSADSATVLLADEIAETRSQLGIKNLMLVEDLPVITATFGYTRRSFLPTFEELSAQDLPTEIRAFPSLDKYAAAQRLGRPELVGTVPILAREGDHEGIFLSLDPARVAAWLRMNRIAVPQNEKSPLSWILSRLEPIDRYYDDIWSCRVRRMVFGLVHTLSHVAMRAASWYSGLERTSLSEYLFLPLLGTVIYDSSGSFQLGGFETLVRDQLSAFLDALANEALDCVYDSTCIDGRGACHGCIQSPEISCRTFNHGLSRAFLIGGHAPWADVSNLEQIVGFWQLDGVEY